MIRLLRWIFASFVQPPLSVMKASRQRKSLHQLTVDTCTKTQMHSKLHVLTVKWSPLAAITNTSTHASALLHHPLQCSSASICEMVTSDKNLKINSTMLRSSSWPAHLHGDKWQRTLHLIRAIRRCALLLPRSPLALLHFLLHGMFFGGEEPNGNLFGLKTFHCAAVEI